MTNYYTTQMIVFERIDDMISKTLNAGGSVNVSHVVLDITRNFPVSPKAVQKRIELYVDANKDSVEIVDGEVRLI